jgi:hypothetical protein
MLDRMMRGMNRDFDRGQHLRGSPAACRLHCRAWALLANFAPWHPAVARANDGWRCPAERLNRHRYHDDWLQNLLVSASLGGYRSPPPKIRDGQDFSNGMQRSEGLFAHPELHYRKSDLERLEEFDLARTFEPFGNHRGYQRLFCPLVASRRFYETCVANKLKTGWAPVRIDPE